MVIVSPKIETPGWESVRDLPTGTFIPTHETGNILSFADHNDFDAYDNVGLLIHQAGSDVVDQGSSSTNKLQWSEFSGNEDSKSWNYKTTASVSVGIFGCKYKGTETYTQDIISTQRTSVSEAISLEVYMDDLLTAYNYTSYDVYQYFYWNMEGALVIDYAVDLHESSGGYTTWWDSLYSGNPDPAFIMPLRNHLAKFGDSALDPSPHMQFYLPAIYFFPRDPSPGDTVTIKGKINNFSLTDCYDDINLIFFNGDPDDGGDPIANTAGQYRLTVGGPINARSFKNFEFEYELPSNIQIENLIYVAIDPDDEIVEIHDNSHADNNNKAFGILIIPEGSATSVEEFEHMADMMPDDFRLFNNYPNPFNPVTNIMYSVPIHSDVELTVYNILGRKVKTLVNGMVQAGYHTVQWGGKDDGGNQVSTGIYFCRIQTGDFVESKKMLLLK